MNLYYFLLDVFFLEKKMEELCIAHSFPGTEQQGDLVHTIVYTSTFGVWYDAHQKDQNLYPRKVDAL
jgi:hypothetical protein